MTTRTINIEKVGQISLTINDRSRRIRLSVKSDGEIVVSMPRNAKVEDAIRFVESKTDWIVKQQSKAQAGLTLFAPESCFKTKFHQLAITKGNTDRVYNRVGNGVIQIFIPDKVNHELPKVQEFIKNTLIDVMRWEAKIYLPKRLKELAEKHGFRYQDVSIKNTKTRWGSCSFTNNINLNLHLMRVPEHLIDYVLLHELAHTVVKNHGEKFWLLLEQCYPNSRKADKEMNNYRTQTF
ncbi:MAG TPA: M48 family peptidase [Prolixibacteraceae bacterium]|jgi:predicted metal-dependent hydrolase|nr:M48 family peptidase [Prolixibacteraceae bacterium]